MIVCLGLQWRRRCNLILTLANPRDLKSDSFCNRSLNCIWKGFVKNITRAAMMKGVYHKPWIKIINLIGLGGITWTKATCHMCTASYLKYEILFQSWLRISDGHGWPPGVGADLRQLLRLRLDAARGQGDVALWQVGYLTFFFIFIGPESDHWLRLSLTNSLTDSLTHWLLFSELDWCDPDV